MTSHIFITLYIFSFALIFYSFLFFYVTYYRKPFIFFIKTQTDLIKSLFLVILWCIFLTLIGVFTFYLLVKGNIIDFFGLLADLLIFMECKIFSDLLVLLLFFFIFLIWGISLFRCIYKYMGCVLLALHLYFYQFFGYNWCCYLVSQRKKNNYYFFFPKTQKPSKNPLGDQIYRAFLLLAINFLDKVMVRFLVPSVILFDILVHYGHISSLFKILPWFYIYILIRELNKLADAFLTVKILDLSLKMYAYGTRFISNLRPNKRVFWSNTTRLQLDNKADFYGYLGLAFLTCFIFIFLKFWPKGGILLWVHNNPYHPILAFFILILLLVHLEILGRLLKITKKTTLEKRLGFLFYQGFFIIYKYINNILNNLAKLILNKNLIIYKIQREIILVFLNIEHFDVFLLSYLMGMVFAKTFFILVLCYDVLLAKDLSLSFFILPGYLGVSLFFYVIYFLVTAYLDLYGNFIKRLLIKAKIPGNSDGIMDYQRLPEKEQVFVDIKKDYDFVLRLEATVKRFLKYKYQVLRYDKSRALFCILEIICFTNILFYRLIPDF